MSDMTDWKAKAVEAIMDSGPIGCCSIDEREAKEILTVVLEAITEPNGPVWKSMVLEP